MIDLLTAGRGLVSVGRNRTRASSIAGCPSGAKSDSEGRPRRSTVHLDGKHRDLCECEKMRRDVAARLLAVGRAHDIGREDRLSQIVGEPWRGTCVSVGFDTTKPKSLPVVRHHYDSHVAPRRDIEDPSRHPTSRVRGVRELWKSCGTHPADAQRLDRRPGALGAALIWAGGKPHVLAAG